MNAGRALAPAILTALLAAAPPAPAQDFVSPARAGPTPSALVFLERGLAPPRAGATLEATTARWFGLAELSTRALACGLGWRSLRAAAGMSQTGEPEIGWSAAGIACGAARAAGGVAFRAEARRDRDARAVAASPGSGVGAEAGGGAWVAAGAGLRIWASAPQLWRRGASPPLARALEIGGVLDTGSLALWLARAAPPRPAGPGTRCAGVAVARGPWELWLEARDQPLRGALGVSARAGFLRAAAAVESHPVLAETVRLSIGLDPARGGR
jgi:hypothetical protein